MIAHKLLLSALLPALLGVSAVPITPEIVLGQQNTGETSQLFPWFGHTFVCKSGVSASALLMNASICNEDAVLKALWPAMDAAGQGARIYYSSPCEAKDIGYLPFPQTRVRAPAEGLSGIARLRNIFGDDPNVEVTEDRGLIRIRIGVQRGALLTTRIHLLRLDREDRYDARMALMGVIGSKVISSAETRMNLGQPLQIADLINPVPSDELPHIQHPFVDVTLDGALDKIARTFKALVLYGEDSCKKPNMIDVNAVYQPDPDDAKP